MRKKLFKSESKRLLDLMINSIYTNQEIFLREIISNASDAIDKLHYISLTDEGARAQRSEGKISISFDAEARLLTVSDNGVGFDPERYMEDGKVHVGLMNVRQRLASRMNATVEIDSTPGSGTTVTVTIPKEKVSQ